MNEPIELAAIMYAVAAEWKVTVLDIKSERRARQFSYPRQAFFHLAAKRTTLSVPSIGRFCGNRDHTTVLHAIQVVDERLKADKGFAGRYRLAAARLPKWNMTLTNRPGWTAERVDMLRTLWPSSMSDGEIAKLLGGGLSKYAVHGKGHRLKLGPRTEALRVHAKPRKPRPEKVATESTPKPLAPPPVLRLVPQTTQADFIRSTPAPDASSRLSVGAVTARSDGARAEAAPLPVSLSASGEREGGGRPCRWPLWGNRDRPTHEYCGANALPGESWCSEHLARAFIPKPDRLVDKGRLERLAAAE